MRVLLVDLERNWRGGQEQALLLLRGLRARGHEAELVAAESSALALKAASAGIPVHAAAQTACRIRAASIIRRLTRQRSFGIVHVNEPHALFAGWLARAQRRAALVISRRVAFALPRNWIKLIRYRAGARMIAVSQAVREDALAAGLEAGFVDVVADGVEMPPPISAEERRQARKRWLPLPGQAPEQPVISYVAALTKEKGHALLLEAFALLRQKLPGARLLLAGDGPLRAELEQQARHMGFGDAAVFAGFVEDVNAIHAASDLFLFPSLQEGSGSALLGAMASRVPVVALAEGGVPEIVEDGRNGLLVTEAAAQPLALAALQVLSDAALAGRLAREARETVRQKFSADRMVENTLMVYRQLARDSAPAEVATSSPS